MGMDRSGSSIQPDTSVEAVSASARSARGGVPANTPGLLLLAHLIGGTPPAAMSADQGGIDASLSHHGGF
jgi:hypothetical protein